MLLAMEHLGKQSLVHIGILKQAQQHLGPQHTAGSLLHHGAVHPAALYQFTDAVLPDIVGNIKVIDIHAGFHATLEGLLLGLGNVEPVVQTGHGSHVGADKAPHTPLITENIGEQLMVHGHRDVAHGGIGTHDIHGAAVLDGGFKNGQTVGKDFVAAHVAGRAVQAGHRAAVGGVVLGFGNNGVGSSQIIALHTPNALSGKLGRQEGIFAVSFFRPAKPGVTHQIHDRRQDLMNAHGSGFRGDGMAHLPGQGGVKAGSDAHLLGEDGAAAGGGSVETLFYKHHGDTQSGMLHRIALDLVRLGRTGTPGTNGTGAAAVENFLHLLHGNDSGGVVHGTRVHRGAGELIRLPDQLFQGHAADQIIQPRFNVELRVLIRQHKDFSLKTQKIDDLTLRRSLPRSRSSRSFHPGTQ